MKIFLSATKKGSSFASRLTDDLLARGFEVWSANTSIRPGETWAAKIADAINESDAVIVVIARDSDASQWQSTEVALAVTAYSRGKLVIPVLASKNVEIPYFLRQFQAVDLSDDQKYVEGLNRITAALATPFEYTRPKDAIRSRELLLQAKKIAIESAISELQHVQSAKSRSLVLQIALLLVVTLAATLILLIPSIRQKSFEVALSGTVTTILATLIGYLFGRSSGKQESASLKDVNNLKRAGQWNS